MLGVLDLELGIVDGFGRRFQQFVKCFLGVLQVDLGFPVCLVGLYQSSFVHDEQHISCPNSVADFNLHILYLAGEGDADSFARGVAQAPVNGDSVGEVAAAYCDDLHLLAGVDAELRQVGRG